MTDEKIHILKCTECNSEDVVVRVFFGVEDGEAESLSERESKLTICLCMEHTQVLVRSLITKTKIEKKFVEGVLMDRRVTQGY